MLVRVDTTNLTRGADFNIDIYVNEEPSVSLYAFNTVTKETALLDYTTEEKTNYFKLFSKVPSFDGYLLAKINNKSTLVKKIGYPLSHFVVAYKSNYSITYEAYNIDNELIDSGLLTNIVDGFYYYNFNSQVAIIKTLKKKFAIRDTFLKLNYDVILDEAELPQVDLPQIDMDNVSLQDVTLTGANMPDISLPDITLPNSEIKEY